MSPFNRGVPAMTAVVWLLALLAAPALRAGDAPGPQPDGAAAVPVAASACADAPGRAAVRAKRVGASWELSVRDGGWRRLTRLAKEPLGLQRSADGAYVAYVDRDFRPDGVLVIQRLADGGTFTGELNALPRDLCFSADGTVLLMESRTGERTPFALTAVPRGGR